MKKDMILNIEEPNRRKRIAMLSLSLVMAIEVGIIKPEDAQRALFRPGVFEKYKDMPDIYRILNLGEELEYIIGYFPDAIKQRSIDDIKELCCRILSED